MLREDTRELSKTVRCISTFPQPEVYVREAIIAYFDSHVAYLRWSKPFSFSNGPLKCYKPMFSWIIGKYNQRLQLLTLILRVYVLDYDLVSHNYCSFSTSSIERFIPHLQLYASITKSHTGAISNYSTIPTSHSSYSMIPGSLITRRLSLAPVWCQLLTSKKKTSKLVHQNR